MVFRVPRREVGQGITRAAAIMVAEEIDARLVDVDVPLEDAAKTSELLSPPVGRPRFAHYGIRCARLQRRRARVSSRRRPSGGICRQIPDYPGHRGLGPDGRSATYGSLTEAAAQVDDPAVSTNPKSASEYRLIGTATTRIDARSIVTGAAKYALDVDVEGALPTVVIRPPTLKGKVQSYDASEALR